MVIDTIEEWVAAEKSSQDANSFGDLSILSESIHQTVRTDSIKMRKSTYSGGLLHYPQRMSLKSGLYAAIDGLSPDKVEKVEIQKHPGYDGNNFPPSKPNEFRCLLGTQRG